MLWVVVVEVEVHINGCCAVVGFVVVDRCSFAVIPVGAFVDVVVSVVVVVVVVVLASVVFSVVFPVPALAVESVSVAVVVGVLVLIYSLVLGVLRLTEEILGLQ